MKQVAVCISGNGSNLQALIDAAASPDYPVNIAHVISNNPEAYGITRAKNAGISVSIVDHKAFSSRQAFDQELDNICQEHAIDIICLAGFMRLLSSWFVSKWHNKILNIHPSLLPAFKGINAIEQAFQAGVKQTGCTVHLVRPAMDEGPVLVQKTIDIEPGDTLEAVKEKMHAIEHTSYIQALEQVATGKYQAR